MGRLKQSNRAIKTSDFKGASSNNGSTWTESRLNRVKTMHEINICHTKKRRATGENSDKKWVKTTKDAEANHTICVIDCDRAFDRSISFLTIHRKNKREQRKKFFSSI